MAAKPLEPAKVMDVTHPHTAQPSTTSRPVIVTNRPMIDVDPMIAQSAVDVLTKSSAEKTGDSHSGLARHTPELVIERQTQPSAEADEGAALAAVPLAAVADVDTPMQTIDADHTSTGVPSLDPKVETAKLGQAAEPLEAGKPVRATEGEKKTETQVSSPASSDNTPMSIQPESDVIKSDTNDTTDEETEQEKTAEQKQADNIEKLIASGFYKVPIGRAATRRAHRFLLAIFILLLVLVVVDILLDLGIIKLPSLPHTTFFQSAAILNHVGCVGCESIIV